MWRFYFDRYNRILNSVKNNGYIRIFYDISINRYYRKICINNNYE